MHGFMSTPTTGDDSHMVFTVEFRVDDHLYLCLTTVVMVIQ